MKTIIFITWAALYASFALVIYIIYSLTYGG